MKENRSVFLLCIIGFIFSFYLPFPTSAQSYKTHTNSATFEIKNAGITVDGSFDSVRIELNMEDRRWQTMEISGKIYAASINTGIGLRDKHLRNDDYFDVEKHPWIEMNSMTIGEVGDGQFQATFLLRIKTVRKEISFPVQFEITENGIRLSGSFDLDRQEFGVGGNSFLLSDDVKVFVEGTFEK